MTPARASIDVDENGEIAPGQADKIRDAVAESLGFTATAHPDQLPGMPPPLPFPEQDGISFPKGQIALTGGTTISLLTHDRIDRFERFHLLDQVELVVRGEVASKNWKTTRDAEGVVKRILVVGIKIDGIADIDQDDPEGPAS